VFIECRLCPDGPGIEFRWARFTALLPIGPVGPPNLLYYWYQAFAGRKANGAWFWSPTTSSAVVKEREVLYLCLLSGPSWQEIARNLQIIYFRAYYSITSLIWVSHLQCVCYTSETVDFYKNVPQWILWQNPVRGAFDILPIHIVLEREAAS
jgi:hypothetical protein